MKLRASSKQAFSSGVTTYSRSVSSGAVDALGEPEHEVAPLDVVRDLDQITNQGHRRLSNRCKSRSVLAPVMTRVPAGHPLGRLHPGLPGLASISPRWGGGLQGLDNTSASPGGATETHLACGFLSPLRGLCRGRGPVPGADAPGYAPSPLRGGIPRPEWRIGVSSAQILEPRRRRGGLRHVRRGAVHSTGRPSRPRRSRSWSVLRRWVNTPSVRLDPPSSHQSCEMQPVISADDARRSGVPMPGSPQGSGPSGGPRPGRSPRSSRPSACRTRDRPRCATA